MITAQDGEIDKVLRYRVCARCYGDMRKVATDNRLWVAVCPACLDTWGGATISRRTAEMRGQRALAELWEVQANLPDLFPNPHKGKEAKIILSELGF